MGAQVCAEKEPGVFRAAAQYGVASRVLDLCTFDVTNNPWRCGGIFDAIITDPPCKHLLVEYVVYNVMSQMGCALAQKGWEEKRK